MKLTKKIKISDRKKWLLAFFIILLFTALIIYFFTREYIEEQIISQEFSQDSKQFANIHIDSFMLWEGDSRVDITIKNKKKVSFWYGIDKIPRIESIGSYNTSYDCFYIDSHHKKLEYAYTQGLTLDSNTFTKWFPFKIRSLKDLIMHYDDIVSILKTFPQKPPLTTFDENSSMRQIRKNPDPAFILNTRETAKHVECDLYE